MLQGQAKASETKRTEILVDFPGVGRSSPAAEPGGRPTGKSRTRRPQVTHRARGGLPLQSVLGPRGGGT